MTDVSSDRIEEWKKHWPLVLACFMGFSFPSVAVHSTGLFIEPLTQEFDWSRTQITAGLTLAGVMTVPLSPLVGALIDKWGVRRLALPGLVLSGLALMAFGLANGSITQWMGLWFCYGLAGLLVKSTLWTTAISSVFDSARGLALAATLSGTALSAVLVPPLTHWLTEGFGWRGAYFILGAGWSLPTLLLCIFCLYDARDTARLSPAVAKSAPVPDLPGLSVHQALRNAALWRIGLSTLITLTLGTGIVVHKVPLLSEAGMERETAAWVASLAGVAAIIGKIVTGWLMDRFDGGIVGAFTNFLSALAFGLLLLSAGSPALIIISMFIVGYAGGTKLQICAHLTSLHAGIRNFGKIFGVMASVIALSAGVGPMLTGMLYDMNGNYMLYIIVSIPAMIVSALLILRVGPQPKWATDPARATAPA